MNPILKKDLRKTARSLRFFLFIAVFLGIACIPLIIIVTAMRSASRAGSASNVGTIIFGTVAAIQAMCVWIAIPPYACTAIASERQRRTFDLLRITMLQPWQIVWGKFTAIMCYIAVFLTAFLPLIAISFLFGGIDPTVMAGSYLFLLAGAAVASMFCLMLSAASSKPISAIIVGYVFIFMTRGMGLAGTSALFLMGARMGGMPGFGGMGPVGAPAFFMMGARMGGMRGPGQAFPLFTMWAVISVVSLVFMWSLFYLSATSLLKPPSWNRSTSLRIWFAAFMLAGLGLLCYAIRAVQNVSEELLATYLVGLVAIPSVFAAIGFCGEPAELSPRLKEKVKKIPHTLRVFFGPGRMSGGVLVRTMCLLTGAAALLIFPGTGGKMFWVFVGILVYLNFCCSVAATARALWDVPKSRMITISILAGLCLLSCVGFIAESSDSLLASLIYINPFAALSDFLGADFWGLDHGPEIFLGFHIVCTVISFFVRKVHDQQRRLAGSVARGPGGPAAAAPGSVLAPPS